MKITFPKQYVVLTADLNLGSVLWVKQHAICWLDRPHIGTDGNDVAPGEPAP